VKSESRTKGYTARGTAWEWRQSWFLVFFATLFGYWVPLAYMGVRVLQFRWIFYGALYAFPFLIFMVVRAYTPEDAQQQAAQSYVITYLYRSMFAFFIFAFIHTWRARGEFLLRLADADDERDDLVAAQRERMQAPGETRAELASTPGRRLLNLNKATEAELAMLPGMGPERARQAVAMRAQFGGFATFAHFAEKLQVPAPVRARLQACFEPDERPDAPAIRKDDPAYRELPDGRRVLELNWASAETLGALPGLGPDAGRRAVALREGDGPFKSLEDFRFRLGLQVDTLIRIEPYVSVISMSTRSAGGSGAKTGGRIVDA
jgi:DNA uptake protein ComE-like DNA-binding protein